MTEARNQESTMPNGPQNSETPNQPGAAINTEIPQKFGAARFNMVAEMRRQLAEELEWGRRGMND